MANRPRIAEVSAIDALLKRGWPPPTRERENARVTQIEPDVSALRKRAVPHGWLGRRTAADR